MYVWSFWLNTLMGWMNNCLYGHTLIGWISKSVFWGMCLWYLLLQWLGSTIFTVWCWCQHRSLGLNQSLWTCIRSIQIQPSFLLRASWTSVVSSCIVYPIRIQTPKPPASILLLHLWSWSLLWGGTSLIQQTKQSTKSIGDSYASTSWANEYIRFWTS